MKNDLQFGIYHTAYEKIGNEFFDLVSSDFINCIHVESNYGSPDFEVTMNKIKELDSVTAWIAVGSLGFSIKNEATIADNGEKENSFNPIATLLPDYKERVDAFIAYLKEKGYYEHVCGFYMDEPLLWNITNDMLEEYSRYFRTVVAKDKRFFVCFSVAGICPEVWTINDVKPITPKSTQYLTDIAFDMYHPWNSDYEKCLKSMLEKAGNREDLRLWMIPCVMNYRGNYKEEDALDHLEHCYEILKSYPNPGGLMCYTYYTFPSDLEALGNVGLGDLDDEHTSPNWPHQHYWPRLLKRVKEIGKEIVNHNQE